MRTTATKAQVLQAIDAVNANKGYKIKIKDSKQLSKKWLQFTIRSERSKIPGASLSRRGKNSVAASWHAHGLLFDELFKINPEAVIKTASTTITKDSGNWQDFNAGTYFEPIMASELSIL